MKAIFKIILSLALLLLAFIAGWQAKTCIINIFSTEDKFQKMTHSMSVLSSVIEKVEEFYQENGFYPESLKLGESKDADEALSINNFVFYYRIDENSYCLTTYLWGRAFLDYRGGHPKSAISGWALRGVGGVIKFLGP